MVVQVVTPVSKVQTLEDSQVVPQISSGVLVGGQTEELENLVAQMVVEEPHMELTVEMVELRAVGMQALQWALVEMEQHQ